MKESKHGGVTREQQNDLFRRYNSYDGVLKQANSNKMLQIVPNCGIEETC